MSESMYLKADPELTFSVNTQLREQLKWLIGIGRIQPGDMLPPAQQLADSLHVNRNTVNYVYTQLRDEGLVSMQKGRGTQVLDNSAVYQLIKQRRLMAALLDKLVAEAAERQLDLRDLTIASLAYVQLLDKQQEQSPNVLLIECQEHDHFFYQREIEKHTGADVTSLFLEDVQRSPELLDAQLNRADIVVTTLNHAEEVRAMSGSKKPIITIGATTEMSFVLSMSKMAPQTKVGFVCLGRRGGQWMADKAQEAGMTHIEAIVAGTNDPESLQQVLQESDVVYGSEAVFTHIQAAAPDKAVKVPFILEKSSIELLNQIGEHRAQRHI